MKLSEKVATMVWAFASGDDRRYSVRQLADEVALLEARVLPVAHEHSPVVVDSATSMEPGPVAYVGIGAAGELAAALLGLVAVYEPVSHGPGSCSYSTHPEGASAAWSAALAALEKPVDAPPPVDERKVAEAYREKVLAEFRLWASRPSDDRTTEQVVLSVDLP